MLRLQRSIGNQAVSRLLARGVLQAKLHVGAAADSQEQEADRVAAEVMRNLASAVTLDEEGLPIRRSVAPRAVGREGGPLAPDTEARIQRSRGSGSRLPEPLRRSMENSFGARFGRVRVHTGPSSDELNRSIHSRAFTIGGDIFFARNQYQPRSEAGKALLAHELTHTLQQGAASQSVCVQRALVDGDSQDDKFASSAFPGVSNKASTDVFVALLNYRNFMKTTLTAGTNAAAAGAAFYSAMQTLLNAVSLAIGQIIQHKNAKKLDKSWLVALIEQDIPQTLGWAGNVRDAFANYSGMTALEALRTNRTSALTDYVKAQSGPDWAIMSNTEKQLLSQNRDSDAAAVAAIRDTAKQMMAEKVSPKAILSYMSAAASKFVQTVIMDYINAVGLAKEALVVVSTGSFGSGELFPYSDIDIQLMKAGMGNDPTEIKHMEMILHNIRMRIRLANMKEYGGQWKSTLGWDVDQLVQGGYDATSAAAGDPYKGLAYTNLMVATGGGESEAKALQQQQQSNLVANAIHLMDNPLYSEVQQGTWRVKKPAALDEGGPLIDFKEKFMRLPKVYLNVLAMFHNLSSENSWSRVDELVKKQILSKKVGDQFKTYLDIITTVRLRYQFFYEMEGKDVVTPTKTTTPKNAGAYPNGYYVLTSEDRKLLKQAQAIQDVLAVEVQNTRDQMKAHQPAVTANV